MKWGSKYGYEYVNRLYKSIKKHTNRATQLYCFTDNSTNIDKDIICKPLPEISLPETISLYTLAKNEFMAISSLRFRG